MKVLFAAVALILLPAVAAADDLTKYVEILRSDLRTSKTELLTEALELTADQGPKFWPIQREYETELAKIGDARLQLLKDYAASYNTLTPEVAKTLVDRGFKLESNRMSLLKKYTGKVSKEVSPMVAARFAQTEAFVNSLIDLKVRAETPLAPGK